MTRNETSAQRLDSFQAIVSAFCDFLTVAVHTILYERNIYPQTSFVSVRKYDFPVRQNRHPKVCQWIQDALTAVESEMLNGNVDRVAVLIHSASCQPLERFVFDVCQFPSVPRGEVETRFAKHTMEFSITDLHEQLRAAMSKLTTCGAVLRPLPSGCSFTILIELKDSASPPLGHAQPWIPAQPSLQASSASGSRSRIATSDITDLGGLDTVPIRAVEAGELRFEIWVEEGKAKQSTAKDIFN